MISRTLRMLVVLASSSAVLAAQAPVVDVLVVGPLGPVAGVAIYLVPDRGEAPAGSLTSTVISQRSLRFEPRIVAIGPGSAVSFPNDDDVVHNVFNPGQGKRGFDLGSYDPAEGRSATFRDEGVYTVLCQIHPEMSAYVVVVRAVVRQVTDEQGRARLAGFPAGRYRMRSWHRRFRNLDQVVTVGAGVSRLALTLVPGAASAPGSAEGRR